MEHKFTIYKHIADLSAPNNGRIKELNYIAWDDREPVYDIRTWTKDHSRYGKGVTLTQNEMETLRAVLSEAEDGRMLWRVR